eukprot:2888249-Pleurochrysis_carterae.AAC.8
MALCSAKCLHGQASQPRCLSRDLGSYFTKTLKRYSPRGRHGLSMLSSHQGMNGRHELVQRRKDAWNVAQDIGGLVRVVQQHSRDDEGRAHWSSQRSSSECRWIPRGALSQSIHDSSFWPSTDANAR